MLIWLSLIENLPLSIMKRPRISKLKGVEPPLSKLPRAFLKWLGIDCSHVLLPQLYIY